MNKTNRSERARMNAGLSVGQAAKLLEIDRDYLIVVERGETIDADLVPRLCKLYGVRKEWILGEVPQHDYESIERIKDADKLTTHDRDVLAEFAATLPRNDKSPRARLEIIACKVRKPK